MSEDAGKILAAVMIDIADALLLGIPSTVVMSNVKNKYDIEAEGLLDLIEKTSDELRNADAQYLSKQELLTKLNNSLSGRNPLGDSYRHVRDQIRNTTLPDTTAIQERLNEQENRLAEINQIANRSLGVHTVQTLDDYLNKR